MRQTPMQSPRTSPRLAPALGLCLVLAGCGSESGDDSYVWPVGGSADVQPISSSFGPRLQISRGSKYDFHRGIDIPTFMGSPIYAIAAGTVTRSGLDPAYSDLVVQIKHCNGREECLFSNYIHLAMPLVEIGDQVERGQRIGYSGFEASSGFPHLHFEIREGGAEQDHCVHPLHYLPIPGWMPPAVSFTSVDASPSTSVTVEVEVALPAVAAGLLQVGVTTSERATGKTLEERVFDYDLWNQKYTVPDAGAIDNPNLGKIHVEPALFNEESGEYVMRFKFSALAGAVSRDRLVITARARDVNGNETEAIAP